MTQSEPKNEIFRARFRVMWPSWAGGYPDQQKALKVYHEHQSDLQTQLAKKVSEKLGSDFSVKDISGKLFEPSGIELSLVVVGPSSARIDSSQMKGVVGEFGNSVKSFFQVQMPGAQLGANLYVVEGEFWPPKGWLEKVELLETASQKPDSSKATDSTEVRPFESSQITTLNDREFEELLRALARKHLRPQILTSNNSTLHANVEQLLSTRRFLRVVSDRLENAELYRSLGKEIETAPARPIVDSLRDLGILDALDDAPRLLFTNLRRSAIPSDDLDLLLRGGIEDPEAELTLLLYGARDLAPTSKNPSEILEEAAEVLRKKGEQMKTDQGDTEQPKKRKLFSGIGSIILGLATAGGNGLLVAGTIIAPNPVTLSGAITSAAAGLAAVLKGIGELRGE